MAKTLSYASGAADAPLLGMTIGDALDRSVERFADNEALVSCHQGIRWSYAELGERVDELARALLALGVARGERVGIWSTNRAEWTLTHRRTRIRAEPVRLPLPGAGGCLQDHRLQYDPRKHRSGTG
jgi:fatty-acyl-CoA synthase